MGVIIIISVSNDCDLEPQENADVPSIAMNSITYCISLILV
jgi:hypothetical protein